MDYVMEFNNLVYLESKTNQKIELDCYINECMLALNEAEGDSKNFIEKAKQALLSFFEKVKQVFARFLDTLSRFVTGNKKWLDKNKTIILNNPVKLEVKGYNYPKGVERMVKGAIPAYQNYESIKDNLISDKAAYEWMAKGIGYNDFVYNDGTNFSEAIAIFFRGSADQIEFKSTDINMTDIFNYCYEYDKMKENIINDKNTLEKITNEIIKEIEHKESELATKSESTIMEADNTDTKSANPANPTISTKDTTPSGNQMNPVNPKGVAGDANATAASNTKNVDYGGKDANDVKDKNIETVKNTNNSEELKTMVANLNRYKNAATAVFTAKLKAAEYCYKSRMKVLVAHVNSYLGAKQLNNKVADAATDYRNTEAYKGASNDVKQELDGFINNAKSAAKQFGNNVSEVKTKVGDWFKNNFGKLSDAVKNAFTKINKETDVANNIAQEVTANSNTQSGDASTPKT